MLHSTNVLVRRRLPAPASFLAMLILATAARPADPSLPPAVDLRPAFADWGLDIRPQGSRGTCSVFALAGGLEYALASRDGHPTRLSIEYLNWAARDVTRQRKDGGFFSDLYRGYRVHGVCPEADMPYQKTFDPRLRPSDEARRRAAEVVGRDLRLCWIKPWDVTTGLTDAQLQEIKATLARRWPVCAGLRWPKQERWDKAVLQMAPPEGVFDGHSVLLVGYRDDPAQPGGGVFLLRNSGGGAPDGALPYAFARAYTNDAAWIDPRPARAADPDVKPAAAWLNPTSSLPRGRSRRVSSNMQPDWNSENLDMTWLKPGESVAMPVLQGPGVITHIWMTSHAGWVGELNALSLRIFWDGRAEPAVEVPLGDFFAVGQGKPAPVESIPVQVSPTGSLSCFWRMPFRKSARIVVTNHNPDRSTGLYWQVDWLSLPELPEDTPYFHARFRREYPAAPGRNYLVADLEGRGHYVGTVLSVTLAQDGWFGEGDDFFFIDGEPVPSLQGTGSEDYFNDAWGFRPRTGAWFGQPRWQGDSAGDSGVAYRWHLPDPVFFDKSLRLAIEHKGNLPVDEDGFFLERPDFFSSVAFWYQTGRPKAWPALPSWAERRVPWEQHHLVRAFLKARSTSPERPEIETSGFFGARPVLSWPNRTPGAILTLPFTVARDGRHALRLTAAKKPAAGVFDVLLDGKKLLTADFRAPEPAEEDLPLGVLALSKGDHTLSFQAADGKAAGPLTVEMLRLLPLPPEAARKVRTHHEAHFIRLAIGRAVYAYRLAYGQVPESLDTLVKVKVLPERYLRDENNLPLKSQRRDGALTVESSGPEPWKHSWQGLDARR